MVNFQNWVANGTGEVTFPRGNSFDDGLPDLVGCEYVQLPRLAGWGNNRHYLLQFPEKKMFILSMMETRICFVPFVSVED